MEAEILVPDEIAVMALKDVAFFPQALLPLRIFEERYRLMLKEVLKSHRLFAVAGINPQDTSGESEPLHKVATVGIVRGCRETEDGISNLLLQGICRIEIVETTQHQPFRRIRIRPLASTPGADPDANRRLRVRVGRLLSIRQHLNGEPNTDLAQLLKAINDPEVFVDLASFNYCENPKVKQALLETLDVNQRLELFSRLMHHDIASIKFRKRLQGSLPDEAIGNN
ncbi:MAG: LON peptidase substrate-binding domain-containing protein [Opitutaceae bacterium]|nr:LON peptidase substrate-binding domain-containing protein [Opitutaceae bacterium]